MSGGGEENRISKTVPLAKGLAAGALVGGAVLLLFGLLGGNWLIGALAGGCTLVGVSLVGFAWFYLKAAEGYFRQKSNCDHES